MNAQPDLDFWKQLLGLLFAQITVVTLLTWVITRRLTSGRTRQWCWRAVFVVSGCWLIASGMRLERVIVGPDVAPSPARQVVVRSNLPVDQERVSERMGPTLVPVGEAALEPAKIAVRAVGGPVWWPGMIWGGVGMLLVLRAVAGQLIIAWYARRQDCGVSAELATLVVRAAERLELTDRVTVREIPELASPITHGLFRASIALPSRFEYLYTREQQEVILCHELTHVASRDPFWIALSDLAAALFWWHPMIWWARLQLRRATEQTADEASAVVKGGPAALAECLVDLARRLQRPTPSAWLGVHGHEFRSGLGRRVRHLLSFQGEGWRPRPSCGQIAAMLSAAAAAVGLGIAGPVMLLPRLQADGLSLLEHMVAAMGVNDGANSNGHAGSGVGPGATEHQRIPMSARTSELALFDSTAQDRANDAGTAVADALGSEEVTEPPDDEGVADARDPVTAMPDGITTASHESLPTSREELRSDMYVVDVRRLKESLHEASYAKSTSPDLAIALREYLTAAGIDFGITNALTSFSESGRAWQSFTGRSFLFNENNGRLLIRASAAEQQLVLQALELLQPVRQQITIEARFIEVTEPLQLPVAQLGFDWFLGNTLMTPETNRLSSPTNVVTAVRRDSVFDTMPGRATVSGMRGDELDWAGSSDADAHRMRVDLVTESPTARIIDDAQRKLFEQVLKQNQADLMAAPLVTTLSGRRADISVIETRTVVVGFRPEALADDRKAPASMAHSGPFRTAALPSGPVLEFIAVASADSPMIELDVKFTLTEFIRYEPEPDGEKVQVWDHGRRKRVSAPAPRFRVRQMNTHATVPDGQSLLMTSSIIDQPVTMKDKVPVLGDLPLMGRLFRSESEGTVQKRLFVLITAVRIDPAGNRLSPDAAAKPGQPGILSAE